MSERRKHFERPARPPRPPKPAPAPEPTPELVEAPTPVEALLERYETSPTVESRFALTFREAVVSEPGLVLDDAQNVYLVGPDGSRYNLTEVAISGGGFAGWVPDDSNPANVTVTTNDDESESGSLLFVQGTQTFYIGAGEGLIFQGNDSENNAYFSLEPDNGIASGPPSGAPAFAADGSNGCFVALFADGLAVVDVGALSLNPDSFPTVDPDDSESVWLDNGVLVLSGFTAGGLPAGWSVDTPYGGDFYYSAYSRTIQFGPAGNPSDEGSGLELEMVCISGTTIDLFGGPGVAYLSLQPDIGGEINVRTDTGIFVDSTQAASTAFTASGDNGATAALDAGNLPLINLANLVSGSQSYLVAAANNSVGLTDLGAADGSGDGVYWNINGSADGEQSFVVLTGDANQSVLVDACGQTFLAVAGPNSTPLTLQAPSGQAAALLSIEVEATPVVDVNPYGTIVVNPVSESGANALLANYDDGTDALRVGAAVGGTTVDLRTGEADTFAVKATGDVDLVRIYSVDGGIVKFSAAQMGFFGSSGTIQVSVSGALSTVTDAAAKAVLTSILDALVGYGLVVDGTT